MTNDRLTELARRGDSLTAEAAAHRMEARANG